MGDAGGGDGGAHHPKVEDALKYLEKVKMQFGDQPQVYDSFLDIMKDFKAQSINTPGVISRVWELFRGHKELILGFNTFLPVGYNIELDDGDNPPQLRAPHGVVGVPTSASMNMNAGPSSMTGITATPVGMAGMGGVTQPPPTSGSAGGAGGPRKQPKEFNHAINYVNKIKTRFVDQPDIYKAFLEILHTYQKEQRTIPEVYKEVAILFKEHPDLLSEFSQFLPETQGEAQAHQAAVASKSKSTKRSNYKRRHAESSSQQPARAPKRLKKGEEVDEIAFFHHVKRRLTNKSHYQEFLKVLNLFSQQIISKTELIALADDILGDHTDLTDWLRKYVGYTAPRSHSARANAEEEMVSADNFELLDYTSLKRLGTSYRLLPKSFVPPKCSGRDDLCKAVLNDEWVSVPATDSDDFIFKSSQKNEYEERLFKCEDDRYELDMVIEHNASTMRMLEPLANRIASLQQSNAGTFKFNDQLGVIQLKAIERIYTDRAAEVLDGLKKNPHVAIPVVMARLRQKDAEWRRVQREWNKVWNEINEANYQKSLDHKSVSFKATDRRTTGTRYLLQELRQKSDESAWREPQFRIPLRDKSLFELCAELVDMASAAVATSDADRERIRTFFHGFTARFLGFSDVKDPATDGVGNADVLEATQTTAEVGVAASRSSAPQGAPTSWRGPGGGSVAEKDQATTIETLIVRKPSVFYGNDIMFLFFRLLGILYERVSTARELAKTTREGYLGASSVDPATSLHTSEVAQALLPPKQKVAVDAPIEDARDREEVLMKAFVATVGGVLRGDIDFARFEDDLRNLFGTESYVLFTLDRIVLQLQKTVLSIVNDETCGRLLALYNYETTRARITEETYRTAFCAMLDDEHCIRICLTPNRELELMLWDWGEPDVDPQELHAKWAAYIEDYIQNEASDMDVRAHRIFLPRNLTPGVNRDDALVDTVSEQDLECRICVKTYKMAYVAGTNDCFYRKGTRKTAEAHAKPSKAAAARFEKLKATWTKKAAAGDSDGDTEMANA